MRASLSIAVFTTALGCASDRAWAETIHVPADRVSIQGAIDDARPGDTVLVAAGDYAVSRSLDFRGRAVRLIAEAGPAATRIRWDNPFTHGSVFVFTSGESEDTVLAGFTLSGGTGTGKVSPLGGAIYCKGGSSPTLRELVVTANTAAYGGALYCRDSSPRVVDCKLTANLVVCGGGAYLHASAPVFERCEITGNWASYLGGGLHDTTGSAPVFDSCIIVGNECPSGGGLDAFTSALTLINCVVAGNASERGAGFYCVSSSVTLVHCTIAGNRADEGGDFFLSATSPELIGSILWQNDPAVIAAGPDPRFESPGVFDFDRHTSVLTGEGLRTCPDFVVEAPDYHLRDDSPAIDASAAEIAPPTDIEGQRRPCGAAADLGAYETCWDVRFVRGDVDQDGRQNLADAIAILDQLFVGADRSDCDDAADADDSGAVDLADAVFLLGWLFSGGLELAEPAADCGVDLTRDGLECASSACAGKA